MRYKYLFIIKNKYSFAAVRFTASQRQRWRYFFSVFGAKDVKRDKTVGAVVYRNSWEDFFSGGWRGGKSEHEKPTSEL